MKNVASKVPDPNCAMAMSSIVSARTTTVQTKSRDIAEQETDHDDQSVSCAQYLSARLWSPPNHKVIEGIKVKFRIANLTSHFRC